MTEGQGRSGNVNVYAGKKGEIRKDSGSFIAMMLSDAITFSSEGGSSRNQGHTRMHFSLLTCGIVEGSMGYIVKPPDAVTGNLCSILHHCMSLTSQHSKRPDCHPPAAARKIPDVATVS